MFVALVLECVLVDSSWFVLLRLSLRIVMFGFDLVCSCAFLAGLIACWDCLIIWFVWSDGVVCVLVYVFCCVVFCDVAFRCVCVACIGCACVRLVGCCSLFLVRCVMIS